MRTPIIAGNWKMNKNVNEARELVNAMRTDLADMAASGRVEIVLCPPFVSIVEVATLVLGTSIQVGAQNMFWEAKGAYTGEVSAPMLQGLCNYVILGHSERRQYFDETDEWVNRKLKSALTHGLKPIICVGENLSQNEAGETHAIVSTQVRGAFKGISRQDAQGIVVAYEPVWAIGTGRASNGAQANGVVATSIRGTLASLYDDQTAQRVRVQYGGSVNSKNIAEFLSQADIDGALVGGASLVAGDFGAICRAALA